MLSDADTTSLSLLYHRNSEPRRYIDGQWYPRYKEYDTAGEPLPSPPESALGRAVAARRSCREFAPRPLDPADLAALLAGAFGISGTENKVYRRAAPSAGGLYPLELYVITHLGIAHYNVRDHSLERIGTPPAPDELAADFLGQSWAEQASAVIVMTAEFARTQTKYDARGYRFALLECGHVAQNLCLLAGERGLGTVCLGGFSDSLLNARLGLDGRSEAALYAVAVGYPVVDDE